jgi:hypothetical protein
LLVPPLLKVAAEARVAVEQAVQAGHTSGMVAEMAVLAEEMGRQILVLLAAVLGVMQGMAAKERSIRLLRPLQGLVVAAVVVVTQAVIKGLVAVGLVFLAKARMEQRERLQVLEEGAADLTVKKGFLIMKTI